MRKYFTHLNQGQTDYLLTDEVHEIKKVTVDNRSVAFEIILRIKVKPESFGVDRLAIIKEENITFTEKEVEVAEDMQKMLYAQRWAKLLPKAIEACESLIRKIKKGKSK